jgi:hypothetical protein
MNEKVVMYVGLASHAEVGLPMIAQLCKDNPMATNAPNAKNRFILIPEGDGNTGTSTAKNMAMRPARGALASRDAAPVQAAEGPSSST